MPVLGHGVKFWEHFQAADTQAFLLQPGGQSQRREFLLGQRSQVDFLPLTKTGKEIRRRAVQSRAGRLGQFFWRLDSIAPPLEYCGWHGSWHPRICRSHSGPRTGNLRPGPVRPGIRRFLRTYQNSVSDDLISFLLQGKKKAEDILIHVPGLCLLAFFCCQIQIAQLFPNQPTDGRQEGILFMGFTHHPTHSVCPLPGRDGAENVPCITLLG